MRAPQAGHGLERNKGCKVEDRLVNGVICSTWDWQRSPELAMEVVELRELLLLCQNVVLVEGDDSVSWDLDSSGTFSVSSIKARISEVIILAWWAELDRVHVLTLLAKRNISLESVDCPACGEVEETTDHVFISCGLAQSVWHAISTWCKVSNLFAFCVRDIIELHKYAKFPKRKAKAFYAVCLATLWCLWKSRNDIVYNGVMITVESVVEDVKALSFLWVKNRAKSSSFSWADWVRFSV
ncbi:uncharacterized protein LOC143579598 [Bidens hawaiensis]|uniref:uncharacterized protein LOC143579598 n=1 Tax=Bidens hawaiensis TaxID=980011 RepID=UPI00404B60EA